MADNDRISIGSKEIFNFFVSCGILKLKDEVDIYVFRLNGFFEYFLAYQMTKDSEFKNMIHGKTAVFISHRLGSTRFCDKIAMFEDGTIVEEGTHEELMAKNGKYAYMFGIQSQYYDEKQKNSDNVEDADLEINEGAEALKVEMEGGQ